MGKIRRFIPFATILVIYLIYLGENYDNTENYDCESFQKEHFVFNNKIKDSLGLSKINSNHFNTENKNDWTKIFIVKEKYIPQLYQITYNCTNRLETDVYILKGGNRLEITYGKNITPDFMAIQYDRTNKTSYLNKRETYELLLKNGLVSSKTTFFFNQEVGNTYITEINCKDEFYDFFRLFAVDSTFQKNNIKYPLKIHKKDRDSSVAIKLIKRSDYSFINLSDDLNLDKSKKDNYIRIINEGINCIFIFKKIRGTEVEIYKFIKGKNNWNLIEIIKQL